MDSGAPAGGPSFEGLEKHEAGVSDLLAAYELVEQSYFPAAYASAPNVEQKIASNSTRPLPFARRYPPTPHSELKREKPIQAG